MAQFYVFLESIEWFGWVLVAALGIFDIYGISKIIGIIAEAVKMRKAERA